ncbi:MAG: DUF2283 domain-containing protein [Bacteroidetes bacterium]|nr:DUF2283 domain-containing protein [Bacteroidota bacterium]
MKVKYDKDVDILYICLSDKQIMDSDEVKPGIIFDYGEDGNIIGIEVLNASKKIPQPMNFEYEIA